MTQFKRRCDCEIDYAVFLDMGMIKCQYCMGVKTGPMAGKYAEANLLQDIIRTPSGIIFIIQHLPMEEDNVI